LFDDSLKQKQKQTNNPIRDDPNMDGNYKKLLKMDNNVETIQKLLKAIEEEDWKVAESLIHDSFQYIIGYELSLNKENFIALYKNLKMAFPDFTYQAKNFVADAQNSAMVEVSVTGTNTGPWKKMGALEYESFEATDKKIQLPAEKNAFMFKDEKIIYQAVEPVEGGGLHNIFVQIGKATPRVSKVEEDHGEE